MRLAVFCLSAALATASFAQDDALLEAATEFVNSPVQDKILDDMLSPEGVMAQMGLVGGQLPPEALEKVSRIVSEELESIRPEMRQAMIEGISQTFTLEEINALNAFYSSEVGASAMAKMNPYMQRTMARLGPSFQRMQVNLASRLQAELGQ